MGQAEPQLGRQRLSRANHLRALTDEVSNDVAGR